LAVHDVDGASVGADELVHAGSPMPLPAVLPA